VVYIAVGKKSDIISTSIIIFENWTVPLDNDPLGKNRNASRLFIFGSCTCDSFISYLTAIMTIKLLLKLIICTKPYRLFLGLLKRPTIPALF